MVKVKQDLWGLRFLLGGSQLSKGVRSKHQIFLREKKNTTQRLEQRASEN